MNYYLIFTPISGFDSGISDYRCCETADITLFRPKTTSAAPYRTQTTSLCNHKLAGNSFIGTVPRGSADSTNASISRAGQWRHPLIPA